MLFCLDSSTRSRLTCLLRKATLAQVPRKDDKPCCSGILFLPLLQPPPATSLILIAVLFNLQGQIPDAKLWQKPIHPSRAHLDRPILSVHLARMPPKVISGSKAGAPDRIVLNARRYQDYYDGKIRRIRW